MRRAGLVSIAAVLLAMAAVVSAAAADQATPAATAVQATPAPAAASPPPAAATAPAERLLTPADNLVVEGIPPVPAKLVDEIGRYTESRSAGLADWHPKRREMLVSTRFGDTAQVHRVAMPGGARTQLTFFPDRVGGGMYSKNGDDFFLFSKDIGGNEFAQNYRYDLADGRVTLLTDGSSRNSLGPWAKAGDRIVYSSTRRNGKDVDFWIVDPRKPASDRLLSQNDGGGWGPTDWSADDRRILAGEYISINESYIWIVDAASGEKTLVTPKSGEKIAQRALAWDRDGKGFYLTSDAGTEFRHLAHMDLASRKLTWLSRHIPWDVDDFDITEDGTRIAIVTNEDGRGTLHLFDAATGKELPRPALPPGEVAGIDWHDNGRDLGLVMTSAKSPSDVFSLDVSTGKVDRWTASETGGLVTSAFAEPELVSWKSFDGRRISGFLYRPPARFTGKRPLIVNIHGGPESQFTPGYLGRTNYYIQELGVAMLFPNVRGSSGYGKTFLTLDNWEKREDSVKDIGALFDWIAAQPDLDADRVMVTGGSYGGYMTLAVATHYSSRIRAAIDVVGISNFVTFLERTEAYRRDLRRVEYGDERDPKMREILMRISPLTNAARIVKPLFVVQGKNDPRVPLNEAEQIVATMKKSGTPVWYLMATDEGHGFAKKKNADFQFYATILFVRQFLLS